MTKVTIVVAIYNVADCLEECIQSIISQTYKNIEIILVNDGSTDDSLSVCRRFSSQDSRIKIIDQKNQGVSVARNNGIENAGGDYIMFVDGDDCLHETIVEELVENAGCSDIIFCAYKAFNESVSSAEDCSFFDGDRDFSEDKKDLYLQLINLSYGQPGKRYTASGVPWGKLYKKSFIDKHGLRFDKKLIRMQDNIFNMQAFALAEGIKYIDRALYMYRVDNILRYKKLPYKPEYLLSILHERERIMGEFGLDKDEQIMAFFGEEVLLSSLKTVIYTARTEKLSDFKKTASAYLKDDIYVRYKNKSNFVSKRSFVISVYMKLGLNFITYLIAKYVKF